MQQIFAEEGYPPRQTERGNPVIVQSAWEQVNKLVSLWRLVVEKPPNVCVPFILLCLVVFVCNSGDMWISTRLTSVSSSQLVLNSGRKWEGSWSILQRTASLFSPNWYSINTQWTNELGGYRGYLDQPALSRNPERWGDYSESPILRADLQISLHLTSC